MSTPRVGILVAGDAADAVAWVADRGEPVIVPATPAAVVAATVDLWLVDTVGMPPEVLQVVRDGDLPSLFLVARTEARSWTRVLRKGVHDVVWLPADADELRARLLGLLARRSAWNHVSSALVRELAHDLRGPLQALHLTVGALQNEGAVAEGYAEDVDALLEAADVAGLMLDGVANLGRHAVSAPDAPLQDLTTVVRAAAARRAFGGRITVEAGESLHVRAVPDALASAVFDVLRVAWIRAAGKRNVSVQVVRFGGEAVLVAQAKAYDALLEHLPALLWRERPILLRRDRVPMPLAGLAYARDVARALGGDLSVRRDVQDMVIELRVPVA